MMYEYKMTIAALAALAMIAYGMFKVAETLGLI